MDSFTFHDHALFIKGTNIEALYNPTVETSNMLEFLAKNHLGDMSLVPTNKLFKSPSGLILECSGLARAMPKKLTKPRFS